MADETTAPFRVAFGIVRRAQPLNHPAEVKIGSQDCFPALRIYRRTIAETAERLIYERTGDFGEFYQAMNTLSSWMRELAEQLDDIAFQTSLGKAWNDLEIENTGGGAVADGAPSARLAACEYPTGMEGRR